MGTFRVLSLKRAADLMATRHVLQEGTIFLALLTPSWARFRPCRFRETVSRTVV